jgi:hypothetical protein
MENKEFREEVSLAVSDDDIDKQEREALARGRSVQNIDWLLQTFVEEANLIDDEFVSITLNVSGMIISGTLISASQYFRGISEFFLNPGEEPKEGSWASWLRERGEEIKSRHQGDELNPAAYIHLKDARVHSNNQRPLPSNQGVWWRGKLSDVNGFWIGRLLVADEAARP